MVAAKMSWPATPNFVSNYTTWLNDQHDTHGPFELILVFGFGWVGLGAVPLVGSSIWVLHACPFGSMVRCFVSDLYLMDGDVEFGQESQFLCVSQILCYPGSNIGGFQAGIGHVKMIIATSN